MNRMEVPARSSGGSAEAPAEPAGPRGRTLVLGLGNTLVSDDGFGPAVVEACRKKGSARPGVELCEASVAGFRLLDLMQGFDRVLLIDVVQTGAHPPGTLFDWPLAAADQGRSLGGSHQCDLSTALRFGGALGLEMPRTLMLLTAEAEDLRTIRESLTPPVAAAVERAVAIVAAWLKRPDEAGPEEGWNHGEARILS